MLHYRYSSLLILGLLLLSRVAAFAQPDDGRPLLATDVGRYAIPGLAGLNMPTDVALDRAGNVYVTDGVNSRVVVFAADGGVLETITDVDGVPLGLPLCLTVDDRDRLWIPDAEYGRVLVRGPGGALLRTIELPVQQLETRPDLAGIALTDNEQTLWLTDNDHHQLLRYELDSDRLRPFGQLGTALGAYHYPFALATSAQGFLFVSDVINGRVQRLRQDGTPTGSVSSYGVELGQVYRPTGVAIDATGNVWIADSVLRVVQAFTSDGRLIGVLRDRGGDVLRFDHPMGLAFDAAGALYVVELQANQVRKLRIERDETAQPPTKPEYQRQAAAQQQPRACTACHFEWMEPLNSGAATLLVDIPPNPPALPYVSRSEVCLSCHDGSVADSRKRVWVEHGHEIDVVPPEDMVVPDHLPLVAGEIQCRTCHSAHTQPDVRNTIETIVFLRTEGSPANLCRDCHADFDGGAPAGMHPLGEMSIALPEDLRHLLIHQEGDAVTCFGCHKGHGAEHDYLLVESPDTNELCLTCHVPLAPALFSDETRSKHGRMPLLSPRQQAVVAELKAEASPRDQLLCRSCHRSHRAVTDQYLLTFDPAEQDTCAACHEAQQPVVASAHDLRTNFPEAENVLGVSPEVGGACSGCHTAHRVARAANPTALDPAGQCMNCHSAEGLASAATLGPLNHPESNCADCHNPHETRHGSFLAAPASALCRECHAESFTVRNGPHDLMQAPAEWPAVAAATQDPCLACHRPHGTPETGLFRVELADTSVPADASCIACHMDSGPYVDSKHTLVHPRDGSAVAPQVTLPIPTFEGEQFIACKSCHDPHLGGQRNLPLLRVAEAETAEGLCITCHVQRANIHMIGHAEGPLAAAGFEVGGCRPCHATHHDPDGIEQRYMWRKDLSDFPGAEEVPYADHYCISCHRPDGPVAPPAVATHPEVEMYNPIQPDEPGFMPLFNAAGEVDPNGQIGCRTCHLTHGRSQPAPIPRGVTDMAARELRARQWHVRTFGETNICTTCHGFDALRRFIFFHEPGRREGPVETRAPGGPFSPAVQPTGL